MNALLFDVGGTKTRLAVTRDGRRFRRVLVVRSARQFDQAMRVIATQGRALAGGRLTAIIGGVPGSLNAVHTSLTSCRHLPRWVGHNIVERLQQLTGARVRVENDSALVGLGEATAGAGRGARIVGYLGIGTGIGGVRVTNGRLDPAAGSFEPGHQLVDMRGGSRLEWEQVISGSAIRRNTGRAAHTIHDRAFWRRQVEPAARGVVNVALAWAPDVVVVGGSMTKRWGIPVTLIRQRVAALWPLHQTSPRIVRGRLGDLGGLWGALALLRQGRGR